MPKISKPLYEAEFKNARYTIKMVEKIEVA